MVNYFNFSSYNSTQFSIIFHLQPPPSGINEGSKTIQDSQPSGLVPKDPKKGPKGLDSRG